MNRASLRQLLLAGVGACLAVVGCQRAAPSPTEAGREEVPAAPSPAAPSPAAPSPALPSDPLLETRVLENGVTYLSRVAPGNARRVVLGLVVKAGSLVEADDEQGLAHFVEHLAFESTRHHSRQELQAFFERAGMAVGAHSQGFTGPTNTRYLVEIPSDDPAILDRAVLILRDWAAGIHFEPAAIERVRRVLLAEKRSTTSSQRRQERLLKRLMQGSRWAERADPIGLETVIQSASAERLQSFYRRWYQPQNLAVVAFGVFDATAMQRRVEQHFGDMPRAESPTSPPRFEVPLSVAEHVVFDVDPEASATGCMLTLKRKAQPIAREEDYRRQLMDHLLVWILQQRLRALPSVTDAPLTSANATFRLIEARTYEALHLSADTQPEQAARALGQLIGELERAARHGFHAAELERARPALALQFSSLETRTFRQLAEEVMGHFLTQEIVIAAPTEVKLRQRLLASVSLEELNRHLARWMQQSEVYHVVMGRDVATLPTEAALRAAAAEARRAPLAPYVAAPVIESLMVELPASGKIVTETRFESIDAHEWKLSNGARVVFKATADEPGKIRLNAFSPGGTARSRLDDGPALRLAATMIAKLGLGSHDAVSTQRVLSELGIGIQPWIGDREEGIDATGSRERLPALFQALHLTASAPGRDATAWAAARSRVRQNLEARRVTPDTVFFDAINQEALVNPSSASSLPAEAVEQLSLDALRAFYLERLGDVGDFTFVFVGDSSPTELKPLVEQYLASLPGTPRREAAASPEAYYRPGVTRVRVQTGHGDKGKVTLIFHGNERLPGSAREELATLRRYLKMRLMDKLRGDLGGVYAVQVWANPFTPPRRGHEVVLEMDCRPDQCESLKQAALTVVTEIVRRGASSDQVGALRSHLARDAELAPTKTGFWQGELANAYRHQLDPAGIVATLSNGERITGAALQASARRYLRLDQYVDALLLPQEWTSSGGMAAPIATQ